MSNRADADAKAAREQLAEVTEAAASARKERDAIRGQLDAVREERQRLPLHQPPPPRPHLAAKQEEWGPALGGFGPCGGVMTAVQPRRPC